MIILTSIWTSPQVLGNLDFPRLQHGGAIDTLTVKDMCMMANKLQAIKTHGELLLFHNSLFINLLL